MVELSISDHEAALVLSALSYFDEEVLPHSMPRIELYKTIKYILDSFGFEGYEGYVPTASERFSGEVRTLNLSPDIADIMERALWCSVIQDEASSLATLRLPRSSLLESIGVSRIIGKDLIVLFPRMDLKPSSPNFPRPM